MMNSGDWCRFCLVFVVALVDGCGGQGDMAAGGPGGSGGLLPPPPPAALFITTSCIPGALGVDAASVYTACSRGASDGYAPVFFKFPKNSVADSGAYTDPTSSNRVVIIQDYLNSAAGTRYSGQFFGFALDKGYVYLDEQTPVDVDGGYRFSSLAPGVGALRQLYPLGTQAPMLADGDYLYSLGGTSPAMYYKKDGSGSGRFEAAPFPKGFGPPDPGGGSSASSVAAAAGSVYFIATYVGGPGGTPSGSIFVESLAMATPGGKTVLLIDQVKGSWGNLSVIGDSIYLSIGLPDYAPALSRVPLGGGDPVCVWPGINSFTNDGSDIYWADNGNGALSTASIYRLSVSDMKAAPVLIVEGRNGIQNLAFDQDNIYWIERGASASDHTIAGKTYSIMKLPKSAAFPAAQSLPDCAGQKPTCGTPANKACCVTTMPECQGALTPHFANNVCFCS